MSNISKVIHYCRFGHNPLPESAKKCIDSRKKFFPDYEVKEWNETNFNINICDYVREAYYSKNYAFVSDYARFYILYNYGGIYFDVDVEIIKPFNPLFIEKGFMGFEIGQSDHEKRYFINPGLGMSSAQGLLLFNEILNFYNSLKFINDDGTYNKTTVCYYMTDLLVKYGLKANGTFQEIAGIMILPIEYLCPLNYVSGELNITSNTCSIHHYSSTWLTKREQKRHNKMQEKRKKIGEQKFEKYKQNLFIRAYGYLYRYGFFKTIKILITKIFKKIFK